MTEDLTQGAGHSQIADRSKSADRSRENKRQLLHIAMVVFNLLLHWLTWWQAALCAITALLHNLFILPRTGRAVFREHEQKTGVATGILVYPVTVLILILAFRNQLFLAAGGWAILSFGDGFATIFGKAYGKAKLPWNPNKSWVGSVSYLVTATLGAVLFMAWAAGNPHCPTDLGWGSLFLLALVGSTVTAAIETLDLPIDDNISAPLLGAAAMWVVSLAM